jgi:parallel beta-helix repeat protein
MTGVLLLMLTALPCIAAAEVHVAPKGDDKAPGTTERPVRTVGHAVELARQQRGVEKPGYRVVVHGGTYYLAETLAFGPQDSGTEVAPTRLEAAPGAKPRLVAGRLITGWEPYRGDILQCDLKKLGLAGVVLRELYCNSERQVLARYPNYSPDHPNTEGWLYIEAPAEKGSRRDFIARANDLKPWADLSQAEIFEFHQYNYYNTVVGIKAVDLATRRVDLAADTYDEFAGSGAERYYFQNLLEELDSPGEWYLDRASSVLYFWPPVPIAEARVEAPTLDFAAHLQPGTEHVQVRGLTIEAARRAGVQVEGARNCLIAANTIRNVGVGTGIGGWGPWEDCAGIGIFGGTGNGAVGNDISFVGGHGIKLTGGDDNTLTPAGNYAENNYIHHTGLDWKQGCGVRVEGVGNRFSRNTVHDIPRMGVIFGGWDHLIELNHLYRLNTETCDTGAVYTGGRGGITPWGCVVRHNFIHDVIGFGRENGEWVSPNYCWGIYLDDLASGVTVEGNIVLGTVRGGVHIHSGRYNRIVNNVLVGAKMQQIEFNGWTSAHPYWQGNRDAAIKNWESHRDLPAWAKFSELFATHPRDWEPLVMSGNHIERNILVGTDTRSAIYRCNSLPYDQTIFDHNLLWLGGRGIRTGMVAPPTKVVSDVELCPNGGFEDGPADQIPEGWGWYAKPSAKITAQAEATMKHGGQRSLKISCAPPDPGSQFPFAMVKTGDLPIVPGKSYRLAGWFRADRADTAVFLVAQSYRAGKYHWARETNAKVGTEWKLLEFGFHVPGPDEADYLPDMKDLYIRLDARSEAATVWVDDVSLREAEVVDEWTAWQEMGLDRHSVVADPLFAAPEKGDYRLRRESPALKLGFQPIPVERIGCYRDPLRASWPINDRFDGG